MTIVSAIASLIILNEGIIGLGNLNCRNKLYIIKYFKIFLIEQYIPGWNRTNHRYVVCLLKIAII